MDWKRDLDALIESTMAFVKDVKREPIPDLSAAMTTVEQALADTSPPTSAAIRAHSFVVTFPRWMIERRSKRSDGSVQRGMVCRIDQMGYFEELQSVRVEELWCWG